MAFFGTADEVVLVFLFQLFTFKHNFFIRFGRQRECQAYGRNGRVANVQYENTENTKNASWGDITTNGTVLEDT